MRKPFMVCPSDDGPELNIERSAWVEVPEVAEEDIRRVVTARCNYIGVNSAHESTCFFHERHPESKLPEHNEGVFATINESVEVRAIRDGMTNTLLIGERAWTYRTGGRTYEAFAASTIMNRRAIEKAEVNGQGDGDTCGTVNLGEAINFPHSDPLKAMNTFSSAHPGGANFSMLDGSVHFMRESTDPTVLLNLARIADGQIVGEF